VAEPLPPTAVVRVSRVTFAPELFDDVVAADERTARYLVPAITQLPGLLHWYAGVSPEGTFVQISVWDTDEHAAQMNHLTEMRVRARADFAAVGVSFDAEHASIVHYPVTWTI